MARNKRRTVKDKEKLKKIKEEARKRWRQKKSAEKAMKKLAEEKKRNEDKERRKFKEIDPSLVVVRSAKDHHGVPLLFGIITKSEPIRLVTKFHRNKNKGLTLHKAIKKEKLEKPTWLEI